MQSEFAKTMLVETRLTGSTQSFEVKEGLPRLVEIMIVLAGSLVSIPLLALSGSAVALTSRGGVIFRQERVGRYGRVFVFYKLRTMKEASNGPQVTVENDARVTGIGKWLRKTKLDELPALWNVLQGDMSLVGPRPEVPRYVDLDNEMWQIVLGVKPGITDSVTLSLRNEEELLASVNGDPEEFYLRTLQPLKLQGYIGYLRDRSWLNDLAILWASLIAVIHLSSRRSALLNESISEDRGSPAHHAAYESGLPANDQRSNSRIIVRTPGSCGSRPSQSAVDTLPR
jgi:lipopolysaccharide/colanic/teichoic acid biosynthesis glycosyltransferase